MAWGSHPGALSPATQGRAGLSSRKTNQTYLRDGEKLRGTADSPPGRKRKDTSSKMLPKPAGRMLSLQAAEAGARLRGGAPGGQGGRAGRGAPSRRPGRRPRKHHGVPDPGSTQSCEGVDELPARVWAAALWAGCWYQTPQVESLGREVIRNSCTSRWFILT